MVTVSRGGLFSFGCTVIRYFTVEMYSNNTNNGPTYTKE